MENINIVEISNHPEEGTTQFVIIDRGNGEYISMPKADYDAQQAASTLPSELSTPTTPQAGA
jgi:hypothetical protein